MRRALRLFVRTVFYLLTAWAVTLSLIRLGAEERRPPSCECRRSGTDLVTCEARNVGRFVPEWRLYGANEDELMEFNEGQRITFVAPSEWRCLEMRLTDSKTTLRLRAWVRVRGKVVEFRPYGEE